ncbi:MAG: c-type cytochrome [Deltaproteobacteria bacterium]|nr:c-type cytochrome [Deltaproteobacteria bacterium]MBI3387189.1 c-type cytochrome [Deltaproteobacteria bacterium]
MLLTPTMAFAADMAAPVSAAKPARETLTSGSFTLALPLGLQASAAYIPDANPISVDKVALGQLLYFDPRLSKDNTIACASCHNPYHGFTDPAPTSKGLGGKLGGRNSPTVLNRVFSKEQFWDGRAADLEEQAHGPLVNPVEMAMPNHQEVVKRVQAVKGYAPLFEKAFGSKEVTMPRIAQAIASYERTVVTGNSPFDRYGAGDKDALSAAAVRGMSLFNGKANCKVCHAGFNFSDESYHNLGVGMETPKPDLGRFEISKAESEKGAFKTPTLRNIAQTAPYMHDGSEATLTQVVEFYNRGGVKNPWLSKEIKPLGLTASEVTDLVAFLDALTGDVSNAEPPASLPK